MGIPDINFPIKRLSKFRNLNLFQEFKDREEDNLAKYKDKYINDNLLDFSKKEKNNFLSELIDNIINFKKKYLNQEKIDNKTRANIISNYQLFHDMEKCLIEISYLSDRNYRNNKIASLYRWYQNILYKNKITKRIKSKSYQDENEKIDFKDKNEKDVNEFENKEQNQNIILVKKEEADISNQDKNREMIKEKPHFDKNENKKILIPTKTESKKNIIPKKINYLSESSCTKHHLIVSSPSIPLNSDKIINSKKFQKNFIAPIDIKKNCASIKSLPKSNSEVILSSFNTPKCQRKYILPNIRNDYTFRTVEKNILDNKIQSLREKRNLEEIKKNINMFGISRAKFKENVTNKYEIKELINMYLNENKNNININKSKLIKKYLNIKNIYNIDKNISTEDKKDENKKIQIGKKNKIFNGIEHIKIFVNKIKNINHSTNIIKDNNINIMTFNIKMKITRIKCKNNLLSKCIRNKRALSSQITNNLISKKFLVNENILNKNNSLDNIIEKEDLYKSDLNDSTSTNDAKHYYENNRYKNEEEEEEQNNQFNFSLFNKKNLEKISYCKKNKLSELKCKSLNLSEKKKLDMINNYNKNKFDFLCMRKNMENLNKIEPKKLKIKYKNNLSKKTRLNDNNDENNKIYENKNYEKNDILLTKRFNIYNDLVKPINNKYYSLYYLPRPGSKLLIKK